MSLLSPPLDHPSNAFFRIRFDPIYLNDWSKKWTNFVIAKGSSKKDVLFSPPDAKKK